MLTEERLIAREGARYSWLFLVSGILWLLIVWMVLRLNATSITTVGVLLGVVFLIGGINEVGMASLAPGGWKVWHYIMAAIFLPGGLWGFIRPVNTFFRPGLGPWADPGLLRRLRHHPGGGLASGEPLLVASAGHRDPAGAAGVLGVGL